MIDFVGKRNLFYVISLLIMVPGLISLVLPGGLKTGIEFSSGTTMTVRFANEVEQSDLRAAIAELGHENARIQTATDGRYIIRTELIEGAGSIKPIGPSLPSERENLEAALQDRFGPLVDGDGDVTNRFLEFSSVSPSVSSDIGRNAAIAVVVASLAILVYITLSFAAVPNAFRLGACTIVALGHDVVLVMGAASLLGRFFDFEIDTLFITAMLTIIGFSVHDSIVVFDRVRENVRRSEAAGYHVEMADAVNASLNQTLGRSLNTSITVVLTLVALILLGGATIREFLVIMLIGLVSGTYSSIFVAAQLLISWDEGDLPRALGRRTEAVEAA
ncbi:MAG: protein translocase subunit SecF [Dehalococcoidia bacterium]|nr:protein translocase subunit SecF [Dehalococcoidia bacterium]